MAETAVVLETVNILSPETQVMTGAALITGTFVRLAAVGGTLQMIAFSLCCWEGEWLALFDSTLIYAVVVLTVGALTAGRIAGLDSSKSVVSR